MRVLHLDTGRELRGGQRQALILFKGLQSKPVEQELLCLGELQRATGAMRLSALTVRRAAAKADLIHAHDAKAHTLAVLFGRGRPLIVSRRVAFSIHTGPFSRWKYAKPALYLAVSSFVRERLISGGVPSERIRVVPDGIPPPVPAPAFRPIADKPVVLAPASSDPFKGADLARHACELAGLELRFSANLDADLPGADLFLYLTQSEGLGSALILASMHAKPIVASRVGGTPEVIVDGETGLLAENEPAAVAEALSRLVADAALAQRCAEAAQARAIAGLSGDKMIARTLEAYRWVLSASSPT